MFRGVECHAVRPAEICLALTQLNSSASHDRGNSGGDSPLYSVLVRAYTRGPCISVVAMTTASGIWNTSSSFSFEIRLEFVITVAQVALHFVQVQSLDIPRDFMLRAAGGRNGHRSLSSRPCWPARPCLRREPACGCSRSSDVRFVHASASAPRGVLTYSRCIGAY